LFKLFAVLVATITGLFLGFILMKMLRIGAALIGAIVGTVLALIFYNLAFKSLDSQILLNSLIVVFAIVVATLAYHYYDNIVLFCTSLIGAYSVIRGISLFAGYFPSEYSLYSSIFNGESLSIEWEFYLYVLSFIILIVFGVIY